MREHLLLCCLLYNIPRQQPVSCLPNRRLPSAANLLGNFAFRKTVLEFLNLTQWFQRLTDAGSAEADKQGQMASGRGGA